MTFSWICGSTNIFLIVFLTKVFYLYSLLSLEKTMLASIKIENTTYLILKIKEEGIPYASIRNNIDSFFIKFIPLSIYMEANLDIDSHIWFEDSLVESRVLEEWNLLFHSASIPIYEYQYQDWLPYKLIEE